MHLMCHPDPEEEMLAETDSKYVGNKHQGI